MLKSKLFRAIIIIAAVAAVLIVLSYVRNARRAAMLDPYEGLIEGKAEAGTIERAISGSGNVGAGKRDILYMPYSVKVLETKARPGDVVLKGGLIARFESTGLEQEVDQAGSDLDAVRQAAGGMLGGSFDMSLLSSMGLPSAAVSDREQLESSYKKLLDAQGRLTYKAPFDGMLAALAGREGQEIAPSTASDPLIEVIAADSWYVTVSVSEFDINMVKLGMSADITIPALSDAKMKGAVSEIRLKPSISGGMVGYTVRVDMEGVSYKLKPGMSADVSINAYSKEGVLAIPHGFAYEEEGSFKVLVRGEDGKPAEKTVKLGEEGDFSVEVLEGLSEGDSVYQDPTPGDEPQARGGLFNFRARMTDGR